MKRTKNSVRYFIERNSRFRPPTKRGPSGSLRAEVDPIRHTYHRHTARIGPLCSMFRDVSRISVTLHGVPRHRLPPHCHPLGAEHGEVSEKPHRPTQPHRTLGRQVIREQKNRITPMASPDTRRVMRSRWRLPLESASSVCELRNAKNASSVPGVASIHPHPTEARTTVPRSTFAPIDHSMTKRRDQRRGRYRNKKDIETTSTMEGVSIDIRHRPPMNPGGEIVSLRTTPHTASSAPKDDCHPAGDASVSSTTIPGPRSHSARAFGDTGDDSDDTDDGDVGKTDRRADQRCVTRHRAAMGMTDMTSTADSSNAAGPSEHLTGNAFSG